MIEEVAISNRTEMLSMDDGRVVKLFPEGWPAYAAYREMRAAEVAFALGIPTPRPYEVITRGERCGIVFDQCEGTNLIELLINNPSRDSVDHCVGIMTKMQLKIHTNSGDSFTSVHDRLTAAIERVNVLSASTKYKILEILKNLPNKQSLCHMDFHPAQIIQTGPDHQVVDWFDAALGDPVADLAKTLLLLRHGTLPASAHDRISDLRVYFAEKYLTSYQQHAALDLAHIPRWTTVIAAARLASHPGPAEKNALMKIIEKETVGAVLS